MEVLKRHVLGEFHGVDFEPLDNPIKMARFFRKAIEQSNMTLCKLVTEKFEPQGLTMVAVLAESHLSIHTWPELGEASVDCFTCGLKGDPLRAVEVLREFLNPTEVVIHEIKR